MSLSQNTREVKPSTWLLFNPGGVGPYDLNPGGAESTDGYSYEVSHRSRGMMCHSVPKSNKGTHEKEHNKL